MSFAAILLTLASAGSAPAAENVRPAPTAARRKVAVSASATVRILQPAIIRFDASGVHAKSGPDQQAPQRRVGRGKANADTVWIEFS